MYLDEPKSDRIRKWLMAGAAFVTAGATLWIATGASSVSEPSEETAVAVEAPADVPVAAEPKADPPPRPRPGEEPIVAIPATDLYDGVVPIEVIVGSTGYVSLYRLLPKSFFAVSISAESMAPSIFSIKEELTRSLILLQGESEGIATLSVVATNVRGRTVRLSVPVHVMESSKWLQLYRARKAVGEEADAD